jgi:hypothetical protein
MKDLFREQSYNVSNKQFLAEVQKRTAEYAQEGYYERASKYSDVIKVSFVSEYNVKSAASVHTGDEPLEVRSGCGRRRRRAMAYER